MNQALNPMHELLYFKKINHTHLILAVLSMMILFAFLQFIAGSAILRCLQAMKCIKKSRMNVDVDENLDPYWCSIIGKEQKEWYTNEVY